MCLFCCCSAPGGEEAAKIRRKIAYRRARAYLSTEQFMAALNDAAYCHMHNSDNDDSITALYKEVCSRLTAVRFKLIANILLLKVSVTSRMLIATCAASLSCSSFLDWHF